MMIRPVSGALGALLWMVAASQAAPGDVAPVPDAEFLEFLGSWHTGDDRWVDPFRAADLSGAQAATSQKPSRSTEEKEPLRISPGANRLEPDRKGSRTSDPLNEKKP